MEFAKFVLAFLFLPSISFAQNLFFRGLLGTDVTECRVLYNPQTPGFAANLVAYWNMDGTIGTVGNGSTLASAIAGGPTATVTNGSSSLAYATGILNQGITANATAADIVSAGTPAVLNDLSAGSFMMWIKATTGTSRKLFYKSDNNGSAGYFFIMKDDRRFVFVKVAPTTNMQKFTPTLTTAYLSNAWHQVIVTWDGSLNASGVKIYVDGTEVVYNVADSRIDTSSGDTSYSQNGSGTPASDASYPFYLLGNPGSTSTNPASSAFSGTMDEFAVWNRVLTPAEVARVYRHQKCN
ncbi:LamG domain-containing protein [Bdellovibrio sp. NC01]|uniref:LamG domain-containing protein n=1 Tax=Bdellovibrio sp. NC01 TaxID=2220073 RepID=UPI00115BF35B|nr:LamG domain-containing protein [Bdellovibrio sp. NC01]QDK39492.1 hypothetical protein DOE51_18760 [Bdellovibrio sp. NC01]